MIDKPTLTGQENGLEIAIIGMAGRFPMAQNIDEFWQNLREGKECISFFSDEELISVGVNVTDVKNPRYVKASGILADIELFDASFFGYSPKEAELLDPQQRIFLECAEDAFQYAGYNTRNYRGSIGVYAGTTMSTYLLSNLYASQDLHISKNILPTVIANDKDSLSTRVSYKLDLRGPSMTVQAACSTSLLAVHMACQGLISGECDMALAGGVSVRVPQKVGYFYQEGGTTSPDGHCRAFDAQARGMVAGDGVGAIVLKRLADALTDGDTIHAVIKGSAINNDGARKAGYTAPSIEGQAEVVSTAHLLANVTPDTISYVEAHGTGTSLGDPIEVAALTQAFGDYGSRTGWCALGSVKTNIGHLDAAAGIAGLIKTVLALKHRELPPSINFTHPNPQINFERSPFYVNAVLTPWQTAGTPRRAGVSSFGIGGTNTHIILEEAPTTISSESSKQPASYQLLPISAKSETALKMQISNLRTYLQTHPHLNLADVAYTLQMGRQGLRHRCMLVCQGLSAALQALTTTDPQVFLASTHQEKVNSIVFLFPGQGSQYVQMAGSLYQQHPLFRQLIDDCADMLQPLLGLDLRDILLLRDEPFYDISQANQRLQQTWLTQPALFVVEYALARLWMSWGVHPQAMIGHSIGEYVAACLAGVVTLEDALALVATRGRLIQSLPTGAMLAVSHSSEDLQPLLGPHLSLAAINAPRQCVVSGPHQAIQALKEQLDARNIPCRRLITSHAFHSTMMEPILATFTAQVQRIPLKAPQVPYISNVTGTWIRAEQATDPEYWAKHLRQTVNFSAGLQTLLQHPQQVLLEVGPGHTLSMFAQQQIHRQAKPPLILSSLPQANEQFADIAFILKTLGRLWLIGVEVEWSGIHSHKHPRRIPLPTYPFERQRYWIDSKQQPHSSSTTSQQMNIGKRTDITDWFYIPSWKRSILPITLPTEQQQSCWLLFCNGSLEHYLETHLMEKLWNAGQKVITVLPGQHFSEIREDTYTLDPLQPANYDTLLTRLRTKHQLPQKVVHMWSISLTPSWTDAVIPLSPLQETSYDSSFYSLIFLAQAFEKQNEAHSLHIWILSNNMQKVAGEQVLYPEKAKVLGPCKVIPQEHSSITCSSIDIVLPPPETFREKRLLEQLMTEFFVDQAQQSQASIVAYREDDRWIQTFEGARLESKTIKNARLRDRGVYLITGGLGGIGLELAGYLARQVQARLILIGRSAFPSRNAWNAWLTSHDPADTLSQKIRYLQELEKLGAQVLVFNADVTNYEQMHNTISQCEKYFGCINGAIHSAGIAGGGLIINKTRDMAEQVLAPKIKGTIILDQLLKGKDLDFLALCSSLASIMGGFGQVDYCAANTFLDAFAHYNTAIHGQPTFSLNWSNWQEVGMAVNTKMASNAKKQHEEQMKYALSSIEGCEAFHHIIHYGLTQVLISSQDLYGLLERNTAAHLQDFVENDTNDGSVAHPRPDLTNAYIAPRNELERILCNIWQDTLGIDQVGIEDNFFSLGGDSLISIQIVVRAKDAGFTLTASHIAQYQTIAALTEIVQTVPTIHTDHNQALDPPSSTTSQDTLLKDQIYLQSGHQLTRFSIEVEPDLDLALVAHTVRDLFVHHDILRLHSVNEASRQQQIISEPDKVMVITEMDLSSLSETEQAAILETTVDKLQAALKLEEKPILYIAFINPGAHKPGQLVWILHHLIVNIGSSTILSESFHTIYQQLKTSAKLHLSAPQS